MERIKTLSDVELKLMTPPFVDYKGRSFDSDQILDLMEVLDKLIEVKIDALNVLIAKAEE
jgi:hypothetical protein